MDNIIQQEQINSGVSLPLSKSQLHRFLICAALSKKETCISFGTQKNLPNDILITIDCLKALGSEFTVKSDGIFVKPLKFSSGKKILFCKDSGSTLRFLLPVVCALGFSAEFVLSKRLFERPIDELLETLKKAGAKIEKKDNKICCSKQLKAGNFTICGNISSQFITGLLFALPLLCDDSRLFITNGIESSNYIAMTEEALKLSEIKFKKLQNGYEIPKNQNYNLPDNIKIEADWSSAAVFLCMGALSKKGILAKGLSLNSLQGDRKILELLSLFGADIKIKEEGIFVCQNDNFPSYSCINGKDIPDLIPALAALAACKEKITRFECIGRLRGKESDRIKAIAELLNNFGVSVKEEENALQIEGKKILKACTVKSYSDHRIAMAAAICSMLCDGQVNISDKNCVEKSFPDFWEEFEKIMGFDTSTR